jgi:MFS family permease
VSDHPNLGVIATLRITPTPVRNLLAGVFINQLGAFVQTFLVLYLTFRGQSAGAAALCLAAYSVGAIFGTMLGGELTHRVGARRTIVTAMAVSGPTVAVIPWITHTGSVPALLIVVALAGLATQAYRPAAAVMISDLMPEEHQVMAFSMMRTALNAGAALAPLVAAGLILVNWDLLYWFDGATALLYAAFAFVLLPRAAGAAPDGEAEIDAAPKATGREVYALLVRDRKFLCYLAAVFLGTIAYTQSTSALPLAIVSEHYPTELYSAVLTASSLFVILAQLKITAYVTRLPKTVAVGLGHVIDSVGLAVFILAAWWGGFFIIGVVLSVGGLMVAGPNMFAHPATFAPQVKARYIATMQSVAGLASTIGPLFGVLTWRALGSPFWLLCALINAVAGVLAVLALRSAAEPAPAFETAGEKA